MADLQLNPQWLAAVVKARNLAEQTKNMAEDFGFKPSAVKHFLDHGPIHPEVMEQAEKKLKEHERSWAQDIPMAQTKKASDHQTEKAESSVKKNKRVRLSI